MEVVSIILVMLLRSINLQRADAQQLIGLNNELIIDFLTNFPEAIIQQNAGGQSNVIGITNLDYYFPVNGAITNTGEAFILVPSKIEIVGKSFIGGTMEITFTSSNTILVFGNTGDSTFGGVRNIGVNESVAIDVINLSANVSRGANGYDVNELRVLFMPVNTPLPYSINADDRAKAIRIKTWLNNKLRAVVKKYEDFISGLTAAGILNLSERSL